MKTKTYIDTLLIDLATTQSELSFNKFYHASYRLLFNSLKKRYSSLDYDVIKDILSLTYVMIWNHRDGLDINSNIYNYCYTIMCNNAKYYLRNVDYKTLNIDTIFEKDISYLEPDYLDDEENLIRLNTINHILKTMTHKDKDIYIDNLINGLTNAELCDKYNLSLPRIKNINRRGIQYIRKEAIKILYPKLFEMKYKQKNTEHVRTHHEKISEGCKQHYKKYPRTKLHSQHITESRKRNKELKKRQEHGELP